MTEPSHLLINLFWDQLFWSLTRLGARYPHVYGFGQWSFDV